MDRCGQKWEDKLWNRIHSLSVVVMQVVLYHLCEFDLYGCSLTLFKISNCSFEILIIYNNRSSFKVNFLFIKKTGNQTLLF